MDFGLLSQSTEVLSISLDFLEVLRDLISFWEQRSTDLTSCQPCTSRGGLPGNVRCYARCQVRLPWSHPSLQLPAPSHHHALPIPSEFSLDGGDRQARSPPRRPPPDSSVLWRGQILDFRVSPSESQPPREAQFRNDLAVPSGPMGSLVHSSLHRCDVWWPQSL